MRISKLFALVLTLVTVATTIGCGGRHSSDEKYYLISTNIKLPYWQTASAGFVQAARDMKVRAETVGPDTYDPQAEIAEFRRVLPDLDEHLLGGVLAEFRVDQDPACHAEHPAGRELVKLRERILVAGGQCRAQVLRSMRGCAPPAAPTRRSLQPIPFSGAETGANPT